MALNHLEYQGRMTRDVELKTTQSGIEFAGFTVAWNEKYGEKDLKCFLRCKAWRHTAKFIDKYFHDKGSELIVEGRLETEQWTDKDGVERSDTVMTVQNVHFCGSRREQRGDAPAAAPADDGELPF